MEDSDVMMDHRSFLKRSTLKLSGTALSQALLLAPMFRRTHPRLVLQLPLRKPLTVRQRHDSTAKKPLRHCHPTIIGILVNGSEGVRR